jgi:hypothetical protein
MAKKSTRAEEKRILARSDNTRHLVKWLDTHEAALKLGFTEMHVKNLARSKKIKAHRVKFPWYTKWLYDPKSVASYQAGSGGPTGFRRMLFRYDPDHVDLDKIIKYLAATFPGKNEEGDPFYTFERPKTSKSKKKAPSTPDEDFTAQILDSYDVKKQPSIAGHTFTPATPKEPTS